ncbi:HSR1-like GTP-binding protein [Gracilaria domingensis]|nr:HSR1-like GTP-binding protein [Gracilaria domingensis]
MLSTSSSIMSSEEHRGNDVAKDLGTSSVCYYSAESKLESASTSNGIHHGNSNSKKSRRNETEGNELRSTDETSAQPSKEGTTPPPMNETKKHTTNEIKGQNQENGQSPTSSDEPTARIVLVGNPGVGKSTILNTLVGKAEFESGLSLGGGRTMKMKSYRQGEYEFVDTPGLEDVQHRETAANEISLALRGPAEVILIFIVMLDAGRTRVTDLCCMDVVLSALEECGLDVANKHSIIINKCGPEIHRKLEEEGREVKASFKFVRPVYNMSALKLDPEKEEEDNTLLAEKDNLMDFIRKAPSLKIDETQNIRVDIAAYEEKKRAMEDEIKQLRQALGMLQDVPAASREFSTPRASLHTFEEEDSADEQSTRKSDSRVTDAVWNKVVNIAELVMKVPGKITKLG